MKNNRRSLTAFGMTTRFGAQHCFGAGGGEGESKGNRRSLTAFGMTTTYLGRTRRSGFEAGGFVDLGYVLHVAEAFLAVGAGFLVGLDVAREVGGLGHEVGGVLGWVELVDSGAGP